MPLLDDDTFCRLYRAQASASLCVSNSWREVHAFRRSIFTGYLVMLSAKLRMTLLRGGSA
jgi:hypothetical protein